MVVRVFLLGTYFDYMDVEMKERDDEFELWWRGEDEEFRDELRKKDAKRVWNAAFKAGGARPWWSINQAQLAAINKNLGGEK